MAKKKSDNHKPPPKTHDQTAVDDAASEKLHSLKSLNAMLLKETVERRQQVDSLTQTNTSLESELNRCISELNEQAVKLEIEKGVSSRFVAVQVEEKIGGLVRDLNRVMEEKTAIENSKESEIGYLNSRLHTLECEEKFILSRVSEERDAFRAQLEDRIQIENTLRSKLVEAEKKVLEESRKSKFDYESLLKEKTSIETKMDSVLREKRSIENKLVESNELIDGLKKLVEDERDLQEKKKKEVQSSVIGLNELVQNLQQGKTQLLNQVVELEKKCVVSSDAEMKMRTLIERLTQEKSLVAKDLDDALKSLREQNLNIGQLVTEKTKINEAKNRAESDIIKLKQQLEELKSMAKTLEQLSTAQTDKIKQLEAENSRHIAASDQAAKERSSVRASLDGEKQKVKHLTENISKIEKDMEDMQKKLSKMQKDSQKLVSEKKDLENRLQNEIHAAKNALAKIQKEHDDTKGKLRLSKANTLKILKILKNVACSDDKMVGIDQETTFGEEMKHHVTEVEAIKKVFKEKESVADEMKKQLEMLKARVAKADKGKSFWTMVSSATTVLAAVSVAYVARGGY